MKLDILSEQKGQQLFHYFCLVSNDHRYDLAIGYSEHFFGKAMVTCIQSGTMILLSQEDTFVDQHWVKRLGIKEEDIPAFQQFFSYVLQTQPFQEQY
ncbi:SAV0927 family protein [Neobacillus sp. LXY-4]|uniref:SAV0927 family protein n=1 Tax=Neobacillus sp. LXY-4 TaxID=3379826 RepID=UPI003EE2685D